MNWKKITLLFYVILVILVNVSIYKSYIMYKVPWEVEEVEYTIFEIGSQYILDDNDPFDTEDTIIEIVDIKAGYIQYFYVGIGNKSYLRSSPISLIDNVFYKLEKEK